MLNAARSYNAAGKKEQPHALEPLLSMLTHAMQSNSSKERHPDPRLALAKMPIAEILAFLHQNHDIYVQVNTMDVANIPSGPRAMYPASSS